MKNAYVIALCMGVGLAGCRKTPEDVVVPQPAWKLRSEIMQDNKVMLGCQATDKRLVVAYTNGFFLMNVADTSFVKYDGSGGGSLFGLGSFIGLFPPSLNTPLLTNRLFVRVSNDGSFIGMTDIFDTVDSTNQYNRSLTLPGAGILSIPDRTGFQRGQVNINPYNRLFGAYNESTKTLLYALVDRSNGSVNENRWAVVTNKYDSSPYFAQTRTYSTAIAGQFGISAAIAVKDYFIVSLNGSFLRDSAYVYAVDAKEPYKPGGIRKIPYKGVPPVAYFFFNNHLYGYSDNENELVRSDDGGFTWRVLGRLPFINIPSFAKVNGNLILYEYGRIFRLDDGSETFSDIQELTNNGLDFSKITGVAGFKDKVFATTLSGLYAIDAKDFFTVKVKK